MNKLNKKIKFLQLGGTPYANPLIGGLQAPRDWANQKLQEVKAASKEADRRNARHNQANKKSLKRNGYVNDITRIQEELFNQGYFGKGVTYNQAVDGVWGKKTQAAWDKRELSKKVSKPKLSEKPKESLKTLDDTQAQKLYQNDSGFSDAMISFAHHIFTPESINLYHTDGTKDQLAAYIAWNEGMNGQKGSGSINYGNMAYLAGQDKNLPKGQTYKNNRNLDNPNKTSVDNNSLSRVLGGGSYYTDENGNYVVPDVYDWHPLRDFATAKDKPEGGVTYKIRDVSKEPLKETGWVPAIKGFFGDIYDLARNQNEHETLSNTLQFLGENFAVRQGKSRSNNFVFTPEEINSRNNR